MYYFYIISSLYNFTVSTFQNGVCRQGAVALHLGMLSSADQFYENTLGILDKMFQQTPDVSMGRSLHCILINKKTEIDLAGRRVWW